MDSLNQIAWMFVALPAGLLLLVLFLRRFLNWMEDRGYIVISEVTDESRTLGGSLLSLQELVQPSAKHIIEARQDEDLHEEMDEAGDGEGNAQRRLRRRMRQAMAQRSDRAD